MSATTINSFPSLHSWSSSRGWALAIIALLHLGFFWALSNGLTHSIITFLKPEAPVYLPQPMQPRPPEQPIVKDPRIDVQQPVPTFVPKEIEFPVDEPFSDTSIEARLPTPPQDFIGGGVREPEPVVVEPRIDARRGLSEPYYPPQVIREGGEGTVLLSIHILADGRVGEVRLERSSGHGKLDESAMREAKKWRFVPGTRDGTAVAMWKQLPVTFRLNTRM